jgi:hypothetical protein
MLEDANLGLVIRNFLPGLLKIRGPTKNQPKVLNALAMCRTPLMGGPVLACNKCGTIHYVLHSCRNRHCPRCQGIDKEPWAEGRKQDLLPVKYYHVVFTVPHLLLELFRYNRKVMYNLLFEKSWATICSFARDPRLLGAAPGAIAILHTWDQQLKYHPHIHLIVPSGGINKNGEWKSTKQNGDFFFDVKQMSEKFSAIFAEKLRKLKQEGKIKKYVPRDLIPEPWVVYAKKAFGSPQSVVGYLGRYSHRVAISNARILKVTGTHVTFKWCNRKNNYQQEIQTITGVEFLKRFVGHIAPPYFRRIRHLGFLSSRNKAKGLELLRNNFKLKSKTNKLTRAQVLELRFGQRSLLQCKECGGQLFLMQTYPRQRAPPSNLFSQITHV